MMHQVSDLVRDSKLRTTIHGGVTKHRIETSDRSGRQRKIIHEQRWRRAETLGNGSFGVIWKEILIEGDSEVKERAVKMIGKHGQTSTPVDYSRELEAIAKFSHAKYNPYFVESFGWFESKDAVFITMEFFPHGDLQQYLGRRTILSESEVQQISYQVIEGLIFMHENGFAHRDLKPANLLIKEPGPQWWVKVADFGISKRAEDEGTAFRSLSGTPGFFAPEILAQHGLLEIEKFSTQSTYDSTVDVWSLGEIIYRCLCGESPFKNTLSSYARGTASFPTDKLLDRNISKEGCDLIQKLMMVDPDQRLKAGQAARHPWFIGQQSSPRSSIEFTNFEAVDSSIIDVHNAASFVWTEPSARWSTINDGTHDEYEAPTISLSQDDGFCEVESLKTVNLITAKQDTVPPGDRLSTIVSEVNETTAEKSSENAPRNSTAAVGDADSSSTANHSIAETSKTGDSTKELTSEGDATNEVPLPAQTAGMILSSLTFEDRGSQSHSQENSIQRPAPEVDITRLSVESGGHEGGVMSQVFLDELSVIEEWYLTLDDSEHTATFTLLLRHMTQVRTQFFADELSRRGFTREDVTKGVRRLQIKDVRATFTDDEHFREELRAFDAWFCQLWETERWTVVYHLLAQTKQASIHFLIRSTQRDSFITRSLWADMQAREPFSIFGPLPKPKAPTEHRAKETATRLDHKQQSNASVMAPDLQTNKSHSRANGPEPDVTSRHSSVDVDNERTSHTRSRSDTSIVSFVKQQWTKRNLRKSSKRIEDYLQQQQGARTPPKRQPEGAQDQPASGEGGNTSQVPDIRVQHTEDQRTGLPLMSTIPGHERGSPISDPEGVSRVRALVDYQPADPEGLAFQKDDIIDVVGWKYQGRALGKLREKTGVFPMDHVEWVLRSGLPIPQTSPRRQNSVSRVEGREKEYVPLPLFPFMPPYAIVYK